VQGGDDAVVFFVGVEDVDATLRRAEELGGTTVQPATSVPGVTFGLLADVHGHVVGVAAM
jgi:predicted enzyme related to lactoylglutathione lyase